MNKVYLFWVFMAALSTVVEAQKQDNIWLFGYDYTPGGLKEGFRFRFDDSLVISYEGRAMDFVTTSACISDSSGNLLLYSNGCYIENADGMEVEGSSGLNPGILYDLFCDHGYGYNIPTGMMAIPDPADTALYHFFHYPLVGNAYSTFKNLLHTSVDVTANGGLGAVVTKNVPIVFDTISPDGMHAVKHANGRDWWIIVAKWYSNSYYTILFATEGLSVQKQIIGEPTWSGAGGQMTFSPDGSKLARFNTRDDLRVFDFDRCTGTLSNPVFIPIQDNADNELFAGLAWSADGRYLYAGEVKRILQFDMWASDIASSKSIVAERVAPGPHLAYLEIGSDGYIYCIPPGGQKFMHRIKQPERGGLACEVQQSYYELEYPYGNLPHFPNFRLGPIDGSSCDTLGLDNHPLAGWRYDKTGGLGVDFTSVSWYEPDTWWWDFGDGTQSTERNPAHSFPAPGAYEVCLTVSNQYGSDTKCKWVWVSTVGSSSPQELAEPVVFYPNPTTGILQWSGLLEAESTTVRVNDALGRLCFERETSEASIDLSRLPDGVYFVALFGKDGQYLTSKALILAKK
ncbi:MAG: PKD domain-containing protein [Saprospiraceae bacterium]|nr:PKD domain-containing protein [Saprospiraceae bacterium]